MSHAVDLRFGELIHKEFILELFNSTEFLENGMRRTTDSNLSHLLKDNLYFDFDSGNGFLVFLEKDTTKKIGSVKIATSLRNQVATINGGVINDYFGTAYSRTSLIEALQFLFSNYPIKRIEMNILASNQRSLRFHDKMGFIREGIKRKAWFCNGCLQDQVIMGLLKEEFDSLYANQFIGNEVNLKELFLQ
ncbi:MAG: GNAT family protein [Bacteriovorax sp.]|nr:GNAT family protein [Bacteriovorax sp.]